MFSLTSTSNVNVAGPGTLIGYGEIARPLSWIWSEALPQLEKVCPSTIT